MGSGHTHRITRSGAKRELGYKYSLIKVLKKTIPIKRIAKWKFRDVNHTFFSRAAEGWLFSPTSPMPLRSGAPRDSEAQGISTGGVATGARPGRRRQAGYLPNASVRLATHRQHCNTKGFLPELRLQKTPKDHPQPSTNALLRHRVLQAFKKDATFKLSV